MFLFSKRVPPVVTVHNGVNSRYIHIFHKKYNTMGTGKEDLVDITLGSKNIKGEVFHSYSSSMRYRQVHTLSTKSQVRFSSCDMINGHSKGIGYDPISQHIVLYNYHIAAEA